MTDTEIIAKIAELRGWGVFPLARNDYDAEAFRASHRLVENVRHKWNYFPPGNPGSIWSPLESVGDALDVARSLPESLRADYIGHLECLCVPGKFDGDDPAHVWLLVHATPRQRCMAYLAAHGVTA